jgi:periplasmic copper chaperone A
VRRLAKRTPGPAAVTLLAAAVAWANPSMAHHAVAHEMLVIQAPWVYVDPLEPDGARAFVSLRNRSRHDHALIGAESPAAARVELHVTPTAALASGDEGPVMALPARAAIHLGPGSSYIRLHGIQAELVAGTSIPLILRFQDDSVLRLQAEVRMARSRESPFRRVP